MSFKLEKWNDVAVWSLNTQTDTCGICRNHLQDLCIECQGNQSSDTARECTIAWGVCNVCGHI